MYNIANDQAQHVLLNLHKISHPHIGDAIAAKEMDSLKAWAIPSLKVMLTITDNDTI
jgi:hypothetical protein